MLLGGRTAEELIFADPTTGAQNDIDRATTIARQMVTEFGMSDALGPMRFGHPQGEVFLGRDFTSTPDYSDEVAASIDDEVRALIDGAHGVAREVLVENRDDPRPARRRADRARDARGRTGPGALRRRATRGRWRTTPNGGPSGAPEGTSRRAEPANNASAASTIRPDPPLRRLPRDRARTARPVDQERIERAVREILEAIGEDPDRDGLHAHADAHRQDVRGDLRRSPRGPVAAPHGHVRGRPRRDGDGARHPAAFACASTTSCRSTGWPTSPTSPATTVGSPGCRRSPASSTASPGARRCRSGSPPRSPTRWSSVLNPRASFVLIESEHSLHVDARREEAGVAHDHLRGAGPVQDNAGDPGRGDEPHRPTPETASKRRTRHLGRSRRRGLPVPCVPMFAWATVCGAPAVMGVVNVTPDSFSDGGRFLDPDAAVAHGLDLVADGRRDPRRRRRIDPSGRRAGRRGRGAPPGRAGRRPRSRPTAGVPVSIDTTKAAVAAAALDAGAAIVNDVSAGRRPIRMLGVVGRRRRRLRRSCTCRASPARCRRHRATTTSSSRSATSSSSGSLVPATRASSPARSVPIPGIGFGKTAAHNLALLARLAELVDRVDAPLLVGTSRKSFIARLSSATATPRRDDGTLATVVWALDHGRADGAGARRPRGTRPTLLRLLDVMSAIDASGRSREGPLGAGARAPVRSAGSSRTGSRRRSDRAASRATTARSAARRS